MSSSRDLVRKFFRKQAVERVPFLPTAFYQASRIDGAPAAELIAEAPRLTRALLQLSKLIGADAVAVRLETAVHAACGFDLLWPRDDAAPSIPPDAAPNPPDAGVLLALAEPLIATVGGLKAELRGEKPVLAVVPGPLALSGLLGGEGAEAAAGAALRGLADAACKAGAELLVVEDEAGDAARLKRLAGPIVNTARYYSASVVLATVRPVTERIADAQLLPSSTAIPAGQLAGVAADIATLTDAQMRSALAAAIGAASPRPFLSIDDAAMAGREVPEIVAGLDQVLGR